MHSMGSFGTTPEPYRGLTDEAVLAKAAAAFRKANSFPIGSIQRSIAWAAFDAAREELNRRMALHVLAYLFPDQWGAV